jgi:predicted nucleic acid-binding protein
VAERPAVNASPLIFLSRAGLLEMLRLEGSEIVVPETVAVEIRRRGSDDPAGRALEKIAWLKVVQAIQIPDIIRAWDFGEGESSVLAWGSLTQEQWSSWTISLPADVPRRLEFRFRDTRSHLDCKERDMIPQARPVLENPQQSGMYLSDRILEQALKLVGE